MTTELKQRIAELEAELANSVPRSRYDVTCDQYNEAESNRKKCLEAANKYCIRAEQAEARNKVLEAERIEDRLFWNKKGSDLEAVLIFEKSKAEASLKSQAAECAIMREALEQYSSKYVSNPYKDSAMPLSHAGYNWSLRSGQGWIFYCKNPDKPWDVADEALSHPPTKPERLAVADRDVVEAADNHLKNGFSDGLFSEDVLVKAIKRRAAILVEESKP